MKKQKVLFTTILSLIVVTILSISAAFTSSATSVAGSLDVNEDEIVNVFDLCLMKQSILNDSNTEYSVSDLVRLKKFLLNIVDTEEQTTTSTSVTTTTSTSITTSTTAENTDVTFVSYDLNNIEYSYDNRFMLHDLENLNLVGATAYTNSTQRTSGSIKLQNDDASIVAIVSGTFIKSTEKPDIKESNDFKFIAYFQDTNSYDYYCIWFDDIAKQFVMQYSPETELNERQQIEYPYVPGLNDTINDVKAFVNNAFLTSNIIRGENHELLFEDNVNYYLITLPQGIDFNHSEYIGQADGRYNQEYYVYFDESDSCYHVLNFWEPPTTTTTTTEEPLETTTTTVTTTTAPPETEPTETTTTEYYFKGSINLNLQVPTTYFFKDLIHNIMENQTLERYYISTYDGTIALHYQDVVLIAEYKTEDTYDTYSEDNLLLNQYIGDSYTSDGTERAVLYDNWDTGWFIQLNSIETITNKTIGTWYPSVNSDYSNEKMAEIFATRLLTDVTEKDNIIKLTFEDQYSINYYNFDTTIEKQEDSEYVCSTRDKNGMYYRIYKSVSTCTYCIKINAQ